MQYPVATSIARAVSGPIVGSWWSAPEHLVDGVSPSLFAAPNLGLYMLNGSAVSPQDIFTLTSAAGKTYIDASGVMQTAAANTPRIDYRSGVGEFLLEGAATNVLTRSNDMGNAAWAKTDYGSGGGVPVVTLESGTAGTIDAVWKVVFPTVVAPAQSALENTAASGTATVCSSSIEIMADANCTLALRTQTTETNINVTTSWQRLTGLGTAVTQRTLALKIRPASGTSTTATIYVRRAQLEEGTTATSYIHTEATALTRTADVCALTAGARGVLNSGAGAVCARGVYPALPISGSRIVSFSTTDFLLAGPSGSNTQAQSFANAIGLNATAGSGLLSTGFGMVNSYGASGRRLGINGGTVTEDANTFDGTDFANVTIGPAAGMQAGQIIRLRQLVGWTLTDRASAAAVQTQARLA